MQKYAKDVDESLPEDIIESNNLLDAQSAIKSIHFPEAEDELTAAKTRFKFEELFYLQILVALRKYNYSSKLAGNKMEIKTDLIQNFINTLPFDLTNAQFKVLNLIL